MEEAYAHHLAQAARDEGRQEGYLAGRAEAEAVCDLRIAKLRRAHELEIVDAVAALRAELGEAQLRLQGRTDDLAALRIEHDGLLEQCEYLRAERDGERVAREHLQREVERLEEAVTSPRRDRREGDAA